MSTDTRVRNYWREELLLIALILIFFIGIVAFSLELPFDARLFPWVIGGAGMLFALVVAFQEIRRYRSTGAPPVLLDDDPAAKAGWPRVATAALSAPVFGLLFWVFGFVIASLAAMLLMPPLMGYSKRGRIVSIGVTTVVLLALVFPYLAGVSLPRGVLGDWLVDNFFRAD